MKKTMKNMLVLGSAFLGSFYFTNNAYSFSFGDITENLGRIEKVINISQTGMKAYADISEEEQYYIGRSVGAKLLSSYKLSNNKKLSAYVSKIGQTLAIASHRPDTFKGYHFILLDEPDKVNAFSVPSGFIFVSTGLISNAKNEDELAAALAHEVAHIVYQHPSDSIKDVYKDQLKKDLIGVAADEVGAAQKNAMLDNLVQGLNQVSGMLIDSAAKGYSREKEADADLMAAQILADAGYDPNALVTILKKLNPVGSGESGTHGDPNQRAQKVLNFVKDLENVPALAEVRSKRFDTVMKSGK